MSHQFLTPSLSPPKIPSKIPPLPPSALTFNTQERRDISFAHITWPHQYPSSQQMIDAGFTFATFRNRDSVECYTCGLSLSGWDKSIDPYEAHKHYSPDCLWLKEHNDELMAARKHACRRCPAKFPSNTKLHEHVREHHTRKPIAAPITSSITSPNASPNAPSMTSPNAALKPASEAPQEAPEKPCENASSCMRKPLSFSAISANASAPTIRPATLSFSTITTIEIEPEQAPEEAPEKQCNITSNCAPNPMCFSAISSFDTLPTPALPPAIPSATPEKTPQKTRSWASIAALNLPLTPPSTPPYSPPCASPCTSPCTSPCALSYQSPGTSHSPQLPPTSRSPHAAKSYLTIGDLYRMFGAKQQAFQTHITSYFKPTTKATEIIERTPRKSSASTTKTTSFSQPPSPPISRLHMPQLHAPYSTSEKARHIAPKYRDILPHSAHACRRCSMAFPSNNKLHLHLRGFHQAPSRRRKAQDT